MISVTEAEKEILSVPFPLQKESVLLHESIGRILMEELFADSDLPPFNRVMMDGIAVQHAALQQGIRTFNIRGIQRAGETPKNLESQHDCLEIMTGAVCPMNADVVIPIELITVKDGQAVVSEMPFSLWMNIHQKGRDKKKGDLLVAKHTKVTTAVIGVAASIGQTSLIVARPPKVIIISTGDELVDIEQTPEAHQIRKSNIHSLSALLRTYGIQAAESHLPDEQKAVYEGLNEALQNNDVVILSGGVSKGRFDLIPDVLESLGVKKIFHRITQKPGKPMWFGTLGEKAVFAFPGNPVSTMVCATRYLLPWLNASFHLQQPQIQYARLLEPISNKSALTRFVLVSISQTAEGTVWAHSIQGNGSGDFVSLVGAHGFIEVPPDAMEYYDGYAFRYFAFR